MIDSLARKWLHRIVLAIAAATAATGAFQIFFAGWELDLLDTQRTGASQHFFAIIGMFMLLFGGMTLHALRSPESRQVVLLWAGLQKLGASVAVGLGVMNDVFSVLALGVAFFDLFSSAVYFWYRQRVRRWS